MRIFTNKEIEDIERFTIEQEGVSSLELIERAAEGIAAEVFEHWRTDVRMLVFAGWGNNGADALATARILAEKGFSPEVYLFNIGGNRLSHECSIMRERLLQSGYDRVRFLEITGRERFEWPEPEASDLIIDGIFGRGLDRPLPVSLQMLVHNINESGATVVSIDMPTGLFSEWNDKTPRQNMVHAALTLAIGFPRPAFFIADNAEVVGRWKVIDTGLNKQAVKNAPLTYFLAGANDTRRFLAPRNEFCSKADFGHALICGGSYGMVGASVLAAMGCLRSGAGKVTVHGPGCAFQALQTRVISAMFDADKNSRAITEIPTDTKYTAVAVGPGLGTSEETADALERFLKTMSAASRPVILDADALNIIAQRKTMLDYLPVLSVMTPHAGEFDRLFGEHKSAEERLRKAIDMACFHQIIIVLKGNYTAVVRPDRKVFFNSSGSPALATGGTGDVLTGMICGFMASGLKPEIASFVACYIHGVAGEIAAEHHGDIGTTAEDVAACVGRAIVQTSRE